MNARNIMSREATKFKNIILDLIELYGYFPFPNDLDRFSPIDYHGVQYNYSNQIRLYYYSLARNYTSRVYINGRDLGSLDIHKGREWSEKNRITVSKFKYKVEKARLDDNEYIELSQVVSNGFENIYNISAIPEIDENLVESKIVRYDPVKLLEFLTSFTTVVDQSILQSDEFKYDKDNQVVYVRNKMSDESIYDYLFKYVHTLMEATGKLYRHEHQRRMYVKKNPSPTEIDTKVGFEEKMVTTFATFMYLTNFGVDISKLSDELTRIEDPVIVDLLVYTMKKANGCLLHYANDAQSAVYALRNHHD